MACRRRKLRRSSQHATERRLVQVSGRGGANRRIIREPALITPFPWSIHGCVPKPPKHPGVSAQEGRSYG
jgi:hypothetical protein